MTAIGRHLSTREKVGIVLGTAALTGLGVYAAHKINKAGLFDAAKKEYYHLTPAQKIKVKAGLRVYKTMTR